jgi:hypothetical protein
MNKSEALIKAPDRLRDISRHRRIAFIYGAREVIWPGIVQSLMADGGVAAETLVRCDKFVRAKLGWSLGQMSDKGQRAPEHALEPILTSVQIALTNGWRERGVMCANRGRRVPAEVPRAAFPVCLPQ